MVTSGLIITIAARIDLAKDASTSTSTSTLFNKTIGYNRLARKMAIANLGGTVKRKIN